MSWFEAWPAVDAVEGETGARQLVFGQNERIENLEMRRLARDALETLRSAGGGKSRDAQERKRAEEASECSPQRSRFSDSSGSSTAAIRIRTG